eukprot:1157502-Pelagomonas_calceolata.AAC.3
MSECGTGELGCNLLAGMLDLVAPVAPLQQELSLQEEGSIGPQGAQEVCAIQHFRGGGMEFDAES